jgi:hypothetical protein
MGARQSHFFHRKSRPPSLCFSFNIIIIIAADDVKFKSLQFAAGE